MSVDTIARGMAAEALGGGGSGGSASRVSYDGTASGISASNVQGAIDELAGEMPEGGTVTLSAAWSGLGPYYQTVTVTGATVTANSEVSLRPTAAQLDSLILEGVTAMMIENNGGTLTAYSLGAAPSAAMTIECTVTEVE